MQRLHRWTWIVVLLVACSSCREVVVPADVAPVDDRYLLPKFDVKNWGDEDVPPRPDVRCGVPGRRPEDQPPWADCTLRITPIPVQPEPMPPCGPGRFVLNFPFGAEVEACVHDGWIYEGRGFTRRVHLSDGRVETLTPSINPTDLDGSWGCNAEGLVMAVRHRASRSAAIVHFDDLDRPGRVQWRQTLRVPESPGGSPGGAHTMRASDVFSFFVLVDQGPESFHVASPTGENPRQLDFGVGELISNFSLAGRYLTYSRDLDIHVYDPTTGRDENLTNDPNIWEQFSAVDGDHVVYIDHRTRTPDDYGNANVWLYDLGTRERTAITAQPAQPAAQRFSPVIQGDWIIWEDTRNNEVPLPGIDTAPNRQLFGYNLRTRREVPIVTNVYSAAHAFIVGQRLYYSCALTRESRIGTYVMDLPRD
jgi:hypothetical protein